MNRTIKGFIAEKMAGRTVYILQVDKRLAPDMDFTWKPEAFINEAHALNRYKDFKGRIPKNAFYITKEKDDLNAEKHVDFYKYYTSKRLGMSYHRMWELNSDYAK